MTALVTSWSPSRIEKYESCPQRFKLETLDKLCPSCFKGKLVGFDAPTCGGCGKHPETPEAIARGSLIHKRIENILVGRLAAPRTVKGWAELAGCCDLIKKLSKEYVKGNVGIEHDLVFDSFWRPVSKFTKGAWLRVKLDAYWTQPGGLVSVFDWKTGGIDKRTGKLRAAGKYDDQCEIYALTTLLSDPRVKRVQPQLVFVDAPPSGNIVTLPPVERSQIPALKSKWERKIAPMFADDVMAPNPTRLCEWCPYRKGVGGPCSF